MLKTERVELIDRRKVVMEITRQLDRKNVKILSAMWKFGPRNLLEVSRRTGIPFPSVYRRVAKLEAKSNGLAHLIPQVSKLGLARIVLLVTAKPGCEERLSTALKIPNLWRSVNRCDGVYSHISVQLVPIQNMKHFRSYVKRLSEIGLVTKSKLIQTGEYIPNFPNFRYFDFDSNRWQFDWPRWLTALENRATRKIEDPTSYANLANKKDILIVAELEMNGRRSFADMAPRLEISLEGVKYHYDKKLLPTGIAKYFGIDVWPYPEEMSAYHEILLRFTSNEGMNRFFSSTNELFFVFGVTKVLHRNELMIRTYLLQSQVWNMFAFLSQLVKDGVLVSYSCVRHDFRGRETQTVSFELFDDEKGWNFDLEKCLSELSKLAKLTPPVAVRRK